MNVIFIEWLFKADKLFKHLFRNSGANKLRSSFWNETKGS